MSKVSCDLKHTSLFSISSVESLTRGAARSISAPRLSKLHTETLLLVTLCTADWMRHSPTLKGGESAAGAEVEESGAGVPLLLPVDDPPILYD
jgi:hypothetical protein